MTATGRPISGSGGEPPLGEHRQRYRHRNAQRHAGHCQPPLHQQIPRTALHQHRNRHHADA